MLDETELVNGYTIFNKVGLLKMVEKRPPRRLTSGVANCLVTRTKFVDKTQEASSPFNLFKPHQ